MGPDAATAHQPAPPPSGAEPELTPDERVLVRHIVEAVLPGAQVAVFGSRATGRARPHSDVDLLLQSPATLTLAQRAALHDAFEASMLPFRVDVVAASDLEPGYRARVLGEMRPL